MSLNRVLPSLNAKIMRLNRTLPGLNAKIMGVTRTSPIMNAKIPGNEREKKSVKCLYIPVISIIISATF
jgi:hypothetical protein